MSQVIDWQGCWRPGTLLVPPTQIALKAASTMHPNSHSRAQQRQNVKKQIRSTHAYDFFNLLCGPQLQEFVDQHLPAHRERLYAPTETLSLFMAQTLNADSSCQHTVNRHAIERLGNGLRACSTATGAYCRARQRLPMPMVQSLVRHSGALTAALAPTGWLWKGRTVKLADGTTVSMPDTAANQACFPQSSMQAPGLGFPIARVEAVLSLATASVLDVAIGPCSGQGSSEHELLGQMMGSIDAGDVLLADRYYCTYALIALLRAKGVDVVFEQHQRRITDFRTGRRLGAKDHVVLWHKPRQCPAWMAREDYDALPQTQLIREVKVGSKVLVTTLLSTAQASRKELGALYKQRWNVELDLRNIKTTLGLDILRCKTPQMAQKELWVGLLAYNLIRMLMIQSAMHAMVLPRCLSFKHTVQLWLVWSQCGPPGDEPITTLLILISQQTVGNRPRRVEPRAVKRRPKPFPLLTTPRALARARIRIHGHPRKVK